MISPQNKYHFEWIATWNLYEGVNEHCELTAKTDRNLMRVKFDIREKLISLSHLINIEINHTHSWSIKTTEKVCSMRKTCLESAEFAWKIGDL